MIIGIVLPSVQLPPTASTRSLQGLLHDIDDTDVERFDKQYSSTVRRNFGLWTVIPLAVIRLVRDIRQSQEQKPMNGGISIQSTGHWKY